MWWWCIANCSSVLPELCLQDIARIELYSKNIYILNILILIYSYLFSIIYMFIYSKNRALIARQSYSSSGISRQAFQNLRMFLALPFLYLFCNIVFSEIVLCEITVGKEREQAFGELGWEGVRTEGPPLHQRKRYRPARQKGNAKNANGTHTYCLVLVKCLVVSLSSYWRETLLLYTSN